VRGAGVSGTRRARIGSAIRSRTPGATPSSQGRASVDRLARMRALQQPERSPPHPGGKHRRQGAVTPASSTRMSSARLVRTEVRTPAPRPWRRACYGCRRPTAGIAARASAERGLHRLRRELLHKRANEAARFGPVEHREDDLLEYACEVSVQRGREAACHVRRIVLEDAAAPRPKHQP
jgi:hypothetical protein